MDDEELDENDDGAGVERNPTADKIPGGIDAEREDEPGSMAVDSTAAHPFRKWERPSIVT